MRIGVYAGSFDPPTNGHLWIIKQAARLFDELNLWVAVNPDKKYRFSGEKRVEILSDIAEEISKTVPTRFYVTEIRDGFLVNHIKELAERRNCGPDEVVFLVRGIRNSMDLELEKPMRHLNSKISDGKVETVFLMTPKEAEDVSSSIVKGMVGPIGWRKILPPLVPHQTYLALEENVGWSRWSDLCQRLGIKKEESSHAIFSDLVTRYRESHRHYHTLNHVLATLEQVQRIRGEGGHVPDAVEVALWFHDAIYLVPDLEKTNEPRSADLAAAALNRLGRHDLVEPVTNAILSTGANALDSDDRLETRMTVEADLSILGAEPQEYEEYARQIRAEFSMVPEEQFNAGRAAFMQIFLEKKIFRLKEFAHLEAQANSNIGGEVNRLNAMNDLAAAR